MTPTMIERRPSTTAALTHQIRFDLRAQVRDRQTRFFALIMPVGFLLLFCTIFGNSTLGSGGRTIQESTYYVAAITAFGIVDAAFVTLMTTIIGQRESGLLRRRRATPQPAGTVIAARAVVSVCGASAVAVLLIMIGHLAFGANLAPSSLLPLGVDVLVGCLAFTCLAFAASTFVRSAQSAQPAALAVTMPLYFTSGVFVPCSEIPRWLQRVAGIFPIRAEALALLGPFTTGAGGAAWHPAELLIVAGWGTIGLIVAVRRFKWSPVDI